MTNRTPEQRQGEWADRIYDEAERLGLSEAQFFGLESIARNALYKPPEGAERWQRGVTLSGTTKATRKAMERKGLIADGVATEAGIELAKIAYSVFNDRDWDADLTRFGDEGADGSR